MKFKHLTKTDIENITAKYRSGSPRSVIQEQIADEYDVHTRTVRKWAKRLGLGQTTVFTDDNKPKILIYDIETPRLRAELWWSGKQYVNGNDVIDEPKIISISWKWFGEDTVYADHWDLNSQCDKKMMENFLEHYNAADVVVGINNDRFDNRFINLRAAKHGLDVNTFVRSIDIQKQAKRLFRMPSYSLKYMGAFFNIPLQKQNHEGLVMWQKIQYGTLEEAIEYMKKMIEYNVGDIHATEGLLLRLLPFLNLHSHLAVLEGAANFSCPMCGNHETIELHKTTSTRAGTIQHIMRCREDGLKYKISNTNYLKWLMGR